MEKGKGKVFIIQGPTASGKTMLAIELAKWLKTEIISADSRQFYREMSIGTAKPTLEELSQVKHHFIDSHSIHQDVSASQYASEAKPILDELLATKGAAVIVGGSGMFVDALTFGLDEIPHDQFIQEKYTRLFETEGIEFLQNEVSRKDPEFYQQVDVQNPVRLIRALEAMELTGVPFSHLRKGTIRYDYSIERFCVHWERADLYARIDDRVDQMLNNGLLDEAKSLFAHRKLKALNTVGYAELFAYWEHQSSYDEAVDKIKQHTRNYAKRQSTWLKKYEDLEQLNPYGRLTLFEQLITFLEK